MSDAAEAYAFCERVTRTQAANFYYGIRLLPRERRRAMCAAYAFARRVDDIGDGGLPEDEKLRQLEGQERALERRGAERASGDPVLVALDDACTRFPLPVDALRDLVEGVRMDIEGASYERFDELVVYCRHVAGAIGRVCLALFGMRAGAPVGREQAEALADDLGVALQLTNILRDVREDAENGRVYIPAEDLRRFGLAGATPELTRAALLGHGDEARLAELVRFEAERAREWFDRGMALVPLLDRRSAACVLAMAGIYRRLLERIAARPEEAVRRRVSLSAPEKAWVAARGMLAGGTA
jgi:phytoene synthase